MLLLLLEDVICYNSPRKMNQSLWILRFYFKIIKILKGNSPPLKKKMLSLILTLQFFIALSKINTCRHYFASFFCDH